MSDAAPPRTGDSALKAAHVRFGRAVMLIYGGTAALASILLVTALVTDLSHEQGQAAETLALETHVRAEYLSRYLHLLADELTRLGLRSEVDLLDENMAPEVSLLRLSHERSAFFNVGVAILGADGAVLWSEPQSFLGAGRPADAAALLDSVRQTRAVQIGLRPAVGGPSSVLYVATPVLRNGFFTGALLGAIDLVSGGTLERSSGRVTDTVLALATRDGTAISSSGAVSFDLGQVLHDHPEESFVARRQLSQRDFVVAGAVVRDTPFTLFTLADATSLFGSAHRRLWARLLLGLTLASVPLVVLVVLLRRSLRSFRRSEEEAVRSERVRALGEAVDAISHEVKNSLNGLRVGLEMVLRDDKLALESRHGRAVKGLRSEIEHLSDFTTELLSFSKGVVPKPVSIDLGEFVRRVVDVARDTAESRGIALDVSASQPKIQVRADPTLIHVVVANLVRNALDSALSASAASSVVLVQVDKDERSARVRVADNGPGVAESVRSRLFEPFVTGKPNGVGLGLALSRTIARAHRGDLVLVDSVRGAVFDLRLPLEVS